MKILEKGALIGIAKPVMGLMALKIPLAHFFVVLHIMT